MSQPNPTLLAFDTSAAHCAAVLLSGGQIRARCYEEMAKGQNERLTALLAEVMASANVAWGDLDAIGVGIGPGNFTGIRMSVAAARGLALALQKPAIGVTGLAAYAHQAGGETTAVLDARAGRAYVQKFADGVALDEPQLISADDARALPNQTGNLAEPQPFPIAALAQIAANRYEAGTLTPPAPLYLRQADAALPSEPAPVIVP